MNDSDYDLDSENHAIEQAWSQVMATGNEPRLLRGGEAADPALVRQYTELLGLLPYELAAEVPPTHLEQKIMARVGGTYGTGADADAGASEAVEAAPVVPFERPAAARQAPVFHSVRRNARAAMLAAGLVGLGFLSATVWNQNRQIAQLKNQAIASVADQKETLLVRDEMRTLRSRLDMVTTVARQAYPLRMVSRRAGAQQQPEGIVYVCGQHQRWYLSLRGLKPSAEGGEYRLWFMTEEGKVDGGILEVRSDSSSEMEAPTMPPGTHGFMVTLEQRNEPEGLRILLGENAVNL